MRRKCIVVLGMHRSGTSAITGLLCSSGISIGKSIMPPKPDNPIGFFENQKIQELNDTILNLYNSTWDSIFSLPEDWLENSMLKSYYLDATNLINEEFGSDSLFMIKDPRLSLLLPFWNIVLERLDVSIYVIFMVRNPFEIASSLEHRNNFDVNKSLHLTARYWEHGELNSRKFRRVLIDFSEFIGQPESIKANLKSNFNLTFKELGSSEFLLDKSMKHFNIEDQAELINSDNELSNILMEIYQKLKQLAKKDNKVFEDYSVWDDLLLKNLQLLHYKDGTLKSKEGFQSRVSSIIKKLGL